MNLLNNFVQATPVFAFLLVLSQVPGAPDDNRYAALERHEHLLDLQVVSRIAGT